MPRAIVVPMVSKALCASGGIDVMMSGGDRQMERMQRRPSLWSIAALAGGLAGCSIAEPPRPQPSTPAFYASLASPVARVDAASARDLFNGYRQNLGLSPVEIDDGLMRFAAQQALALARADKVDATRDETLTARLRMSGVVTATARENVSAGYHTVSDAFSGWRGSPKHDATLRLGPARRFGIATAFNPASKYKVYWVLVTAGP